MSASSSREIARLLIDIGVLLLQSGAHTERTVRNLKRFLRMRLALRWISLFPSQESLSLFMNKICPSPCLEE